MYFPLSYQFKQLSIKISFVSLLSIIVLWYIMCLIHLDYSPDLQIAIIGNSNVTLNLNILMYLIWIFTYQKDGTDFDISSVESQKVVNAVQRFCLEPEGQYRCLKSMEVATPAVDTETNQTARQATPPPGEETTASVIPLPHQDIVSFSSFLFFWFT